MPTTRIEMAKKKIDEKTNQNPENTKNDSEMSGTDDEPNFSDPEGYVDDITDEGNHLKIPHISDLTPIRKTKSICHKNFINIFL